MTLLAQLALLGPVRQAGPLLHIARCPLCHGQRLVVITSAYGERLSCRGGCPLDLVLNALKGGRVTVPFPPLVLCPACLHARVEVDRICSQCWDDATEDERRDFRGAGYRSARDRPRPKGPR